MDWNSYKSIDNGAKVEITYPNGTALSNTELFVDGSYPSQTAASTIPVSLQRK